MEKLSTIKIYDRIKEKEKELRFALATTGNGYEDLQVFDTIIHLYAYQSVYSDLIDEYTDAKDKENLQLVLAMYHTSEAQLEGYIEGIKEYANDENKYLIDELMETLDDLEYMEGGEYIYEII